MVISARHWLVVTTLSVIIHIVIFISIPEYQRVELSEKEVERKFSVLISDQVKQLENSLTTEEALPTPVKVESVPVISLDETGPTTDELVLEVMADPLMEIEKVDELSIESPQIISIVESSETYEAQIQPTEAVEQIIIIDEFEQSIDPAFEFADPKITDIAEFIDLPIVEKIEQSSDPLVELITGIDEVENIEQLSELEPVIMPIAEIEIPIAEELVVEEVAETIVAEILEIDELDEIIAEKWSPQQAIDSGDRWIASESIKAKTWRRRYNDVEGIDLAYKMRTKRKLYGSIPYLEAVAKELGIRGVVLKILVGFEIDEHGKLLDIEIVKGSGYGKLDVAMRQVIRISQPFEPFPASVKQHKIRLIYPIKITISK